jgi:hypothetical protein
MATIHPEAKNPRRKYPARLVDAAKALRLDPEWLRTRQGCYAPRLESATPEGEATAIYRTLKATDRENWLAFGRIMIRRVA